jgi:hypothetical protein
MYWYTVVLLVVLSEAVQVLVYNLRNYVHNIGKYVHNHI